MRQQMKFLLAVSAASLLFACAKKAEEAPAEAPPAEAAVVEPEVLAEPMVEPTTDARTADASVVIGMQNGAPYFASAGFYYQDGGSTQSGIALGTGDVDISSIPPGDVNFTVSLNSDAINAGYSFPSDPYQAIAIVVIPPGVAAPPPQFGQPYWSTEFDPPSVSGDAHSLMFVDQDEYANAYEYSIGLNGPNGRFVMDPKITNGGNPPEPVPVPAEPTPE